MMTKRFIARNRSGHGGEPIPSAPHRPLPCDLPVSLSKYARHLFRINPDFFSGVYFLIEQGEVVYVGSSVNVPARLVHHREEKAYRCVFFIPAHEAMITDLESAFIRLLHPRLNLKTPPLDSPSILSLYEKEEA